MPNSHKRTIQSVDRSCDILDHLHKHGPATLKELESAVDLTAGSIHTYLSTLKDRGYVEQDGVEYALGPLLIPYGIHVRNQSKLYRNARGHLETIAKDLDCSVHLMTEYDGKLLILEEEYDTDVVGKEYHIEKRGKLHYNIHCTAGGKAILAALPQERVDEILAEHSFPSRTPNTITDEEELREELAEVRDRGYALNDQEDMIRIRGVGAPIMHESSTEVLGTISVSGPASTWTGDVFREEIPNRLLEVTNDIEVNIHSAEESTV